MSGSVFTILGAGGFIGQALTDYLRASGHIVYTPARELPLEQLIESLQGHVVYCIGLTSDFRDRPWDTVEAHVGVLRHILAQGRFDSLTYLSSTRVYLGCEVGHEDAPLMVHPQMPDDLYNLSKLLGESMCYRAHSVQRPIRVVRLSNVISGQQTSGNFLGLLLSEALETGVVKLKTTLESAKDYIALGDVVRMLELIALSGKEQCYNLASGIQVTNRELVEMISSMTGAGYLVDEKATHVSFPSIDVTRIESEFGFSPIQPLDEIRRILEGDSFSFFRLF